MPNPISFSSPQKVAELHEILEARESKLIDLSMRNAELSESNFNLKR